MMICPPGLRTPAASQSAFSGSLKRERAATIKIRSKLCLLKGRNSATPSTTCIPLFSAIFAIDPAGSSPYLIPRGTANLPVPAPISRVLRIPGFSGMNVFRARSSDSYAGLYFSYQASYFSAYLSKASQDFIKIPLDEFCFIPKLVRFFNFFCCSYISYTCDSLFTSTSNLLYFTWSLHNIRMELKFTQCSTFCAICCGIMYWTFKPIWICEIISGYNIKSIK